MCFLSSWIASPPCNKTVFKSSWTKCCTCSSQVCLQLWINVCSYTRHSDHDLFWACAFWQNNCTENTGSRKALHCASGGCVAENTSQFHIQLMMESFSDWHQHCKSQHVLGGFSGEQDEISVIWGLRRSVSLKKKRIYPSSMTFIYIHQP